MTTRRRTRSWLLLLCLAALNMGRVDCGGEPNWAVVITSPGNGTFTNASSIHVQGHIVGGADGVFSLTVNGISGLPLDGKDFDVVVPLDPSSVFNPIVVEMVTWNGILRRDRATLIVGDGVDSGFVLEGDPSPQSLALRLDDAGLGQITPIVETLSTDALDVSALITDQNPLLDDECVVDSGLGCLYNATVNAVEVGFSSFGIAAQANDVTGTLDADITIDDFFIEIDMNVRDQVAVSFTCGLEIESSTTTISGSFDLEPDSVDPSFADVNLVGAVSVDLAGFTSQFISGICDDPLLGDIIQLIVGPSMIQGLVQSGFEDNLNDPDGAGPLDSPIAAAIQEALAGISIAGPIGETIGVDLEAPIDSISEDADGVTILADATITNPDPHYLAPDLTASYTVMEAPPSFGSTTPVGGLPYGMAFGIGTSAMNQLLKTQIEGGLLRQTITEFGGFPITTATFSLFIPEFSVIQPPQPLAIQIRPQLAPVMTGQPGPGGELAEMKIGGLRVKMVTASGLLALDLFIDADAGVDLTFDSEGLSFGLAPLDPQDIDITVAGNRIGADELGIISAFEALFPLFASELEGALGSFPIPSLLGLDLSPVEVSEVGDFIGLFADLNLTPTTSIQNVVITDESSGDYRQSGGCFINEWRHRVSGSTLGGVSVNLKGMLGADAGCTTNDQTANATARYRVNFDVVAVAGEEWTLDIDHSILGAFTIYDESNIFGDGGGTARFDSDVTASWQVIGGNSGTFDFTPSVTSLHHPISGSEFDSNVEFTGSNSVQVVGTTSESIELVFEFDLHTFSNSNVAFPAITGDEVGIRLGKNDTIDANFTAGAYPGSGNRNVADDGHRMSVSLSVAPAP